MSKNNKISAIIVDDSAQARKLLRLMLHELAEDVEIKGEAENALEANNLIITTSPDVVFLDIEMPGKSGIQLAEEFVNSDASFSVVFTTAYNHYAIKAFRLSAIDYLLKPIDEQQLLEALEKLRGRLHLVNSKKQLTNLVENLKLNQSGDGILTVPVQNGHEYLPINEIEYLEADGSYVTIYMTDNKTKTVSKNLKYFETALLEFNQFIRVHRSYLVNIKHVKRFDKSERAKLVMTSGTQIDISRDRRGDFLATMRQFQE